MDGVGNLIRSELQRLGQSHLHRCSDFDIERPAPTAGARIARALARPEGFDQAVPSSLSLFAA